MRFLLCILAVILTYQSVNAQSLWRNSATTNRTPWVVSGSTNIVGTITNPITTAGGVNSTGGFTSAGSNYFGTVVSDDLSLNPGYNNVWAGKWAMDNSVMDGSVVNSTAFGFDALSKNVSGSANTAFGYDASWSNLSGGALSSFGSQAGLSNYVGSVNSLFGSQSGRNSTNSSANSFFGADSGYSLNSGDGNTFIGRGSGFGPLFGEHNLFLGFYSGFYETASTNLFFVDSIDRGSSGAGRSGALMFGKFDATPANQQLTINASVGIGRPATTTALTLDTTGTAVEVWYANSGTLIGQLLGSNNDLNVVPNTNYRLGSYGNNQFVLTTGNGNVGIGRGVPMASLDVLGNGRFMEETAGGVITIGSSNDFPATLVLAPYQTALTPAYSWLITANKGSGSYRLDIGEPSRTYMTILNHVEGAAGGNVGIGDTSPSAKLDVAGDIRASTTITATNGFLGGNLTEGNYLAVGANGLIINTNPPEARIVGSTNKLDTDLRQYTLNATNKLDTDLKSYTDTAKLNATNGLYAALKASYTPMTTNGHVQGTFTLGQFQRTNTAAAITITSLTGATGSDALSGVLVISNSAATSQLITWPAEWINNLGYVSAYCTNAECMVISVNCLPGVMTNAAIVRTRKGAAGVAP